MNTNEHLQGGMILPSPDLRIDAETCKLVLDQSGAYIFIKNTKGEYVYVNALTQQLFNRELEDIIGHDDSHFFDLDISADIRKNDRRVLEAGEVVIEKETNIIKETGETRVYQAVKKPIYNNQGTIVGLLGVSTDITELHNLKEQLKMLSLTDSLTNTRNRQAYNDIIGESLTLFKQKGTPFSIILFDIDNFKQINDIWGHHTGDTVLKELAALIQSHISESGLLFRMGGEEFLILLPGTQLEQAVAIAEHIRKRVEQDLNTLDDRPVTISIGVAEIQKDETETCLYKRVDDLLYQSKRSGKNRVTY